MLGHVASRDRLAFRPQAQGEHAVKPTAHVSKPRRPARAGLLLAGFLVSWISGPSTFAADARTFHVDPRGNDSWSGTLPRPNAAGTDGPFATIVRARDAVRDAHRGPAAPATVVLHAGRHELRETFVLTPDDSGTAESPVTYTAAPGDEGRVILSGGRLVSDWKTLDHGDWVAEVPDLTKGWRFRQATLGGQWRGRSRLPNTGTYDMAGLAGADIKAKYDTPANRFEFKPGEIAPSWKNLNDVEVVVLHFWVDSHFRIQSIDPEKRVVTLDRFSRRKFSDDYRLQPARYYITNVYEALEPGQFYADTSAGRLYYRPRSGETPGAAPFVAPRLVSLLEFRGDPRAGKFVEHVAFRGLTFSDTTYEPGSRDAVDGQAASEVPGAITVTGAHSITFEACQLKNLAGYAVDLRDGCRGVTLRGNTITEIGAGGVKISGGRANAPDALKTGENQIVDNRLTRLGRLFQSGVGLLLMHTFGNTVAHNEIADLYYTAVSVGWVWGYAPSVSRDNRIEFNHLHHVGQGVLSDMGGVYTLGVSPGTVVRNNRIHDVEAHGYGGWGLYTDEGSTGILLENNVVYRTTHGGFHQHYGRDNIVRNNILALAREEQIARSRNEEHRSFTFEHNIVYYRTGKLFGHNWSGDPGRMTLDSNVYWNAAGAVPEFPGGSLKAWQERGFDVHSVVADPRFVDPEHDNYRLQKDSPALSLGFQPIDDSTVGPRVKTPGEHASTR